MKRLGLRDLVGAGPRAVGRYTGTLLAVFVAQSLVAIAAMVAIAVVLAQQFAHLPKFDDGIDGDALALAWCIRYSYSHLIACAGIVLGALFLWELASWFVVGGLVGVLAQRPEGRGDTARCFGAAGATTYLKYARLALCSLPAWMLVFFVLGTGTALVKTRLQYALTIPELTFALVLGVLPAMILWHVASTINDYARTELTMRDASHDPGVIRTYLRAVAFVIKRPVTLLHAALGWIAFALITIAYATLAHGHGMLGAEGAVTLFVIRQGVALARTAVRMGVLAGQVELGRTRGMPAPKVEPKKSARPD
jgi:hypothetical protein